MTTMLLGRRGQPFCGKCCGEHTNAGSQIQKRRFRRVEKRELAKLIREEGF